MAGRLTLNQEMEVRILLSQPSPLFNKQEYLCEIV